MAANWELTLGIPVYWPTKRRLRNSHGYIEREEALANAYMLRGFRYPARFMADSRGAWSTLGAFCSSMPPGYRDGPELAYSRTRYIADCREFSAEFEASVDREWRVPRPALDTLIFYPNVVRIDWRHCPIIVYDRLGLLRSLGICVSLFETVFVVETQAFLKDLAKLGSRIEKSWHRRKALLARSAHLASNGLQKWSLGGPGCWSVNVDGNYRVHLRNDRQIGTFVTEGIGDHKSMGHG
jgi:hypothetical protein